MSLSNMSYGTLQHSLKLGFRSENNVENDHLIHEYNGAGESASTVADGSICLMVVDDV